MFHIIDDQQFVRDLTAKIFTVLGYQTLTFASPEEYIDFVKSSGFTNPIAVVTDVRMPTMSGYQLIEEVSKIKPDLRYIVMTGDPTVEFQQVDKVSGFLSKPLRIHDLSALLDRLTEQLTALPSGEGGCSDLRNWGKSTRYENWGCEPNCTLCS